MQKKARERTYTYQYKPRARDLADCLDPCWRRAAEHGWAPELRAGKSGHRGPSVIAPAVLFLHASAPGTQNANILFCASKTIHLPVDLHASFAPPAGFY